MPAGVMTVTSTIPGEPGGTITSMLLEEVTRSRSGMVRWSTHKSPRRRSCTRRYPNHRSRSPWLLSRTDDLIENATGRIAARLAYRAELEAVEGVESFERENKYLEAVVALSSRRALSRFAFVAERS